VAAGLTVGALSAMAVTLSAPALALPTAPAAVKWTGLKLINGWQNAAYSTSKAAVTNISGIVYLRGGIHNGSGTQVFVLPPAFRPALTVYLNVDLCGANKGQLIINHKGKAYVLSEGAFSTAQCFTSLDGVSFARSGNSFTSLKLLNGWHPESPITAKPQARVISGIVHLRGGMWTAGNSQHPFVLPRGFRPATTVYVPVDLDNSNLGQLIIQRNGTVTVNSEISFANAQGFTSLDGVTFALSGASFTTLKLLNGWKIDPEGSYPKPAARQSSGIVRLRGAIVTSGSDPIAFRLPKAMRPAHAVFVPVVLCLTNNGRLDISPDGTVLVEAEGGTFSHAQCLTSLEGAWFAR